MKTLVSSIFFCISVCRTGSDFTLDEDRHYSSMVYNERQGRRLFFLFLFIDTLLPYYNHILQTATLTSVADCYCEKFSLPPRFLCIKRSV